MARWLKVQEADRKRKLHIKKGDTVYVIAGKEKGKTGKVVKIIKDENKAVVEKLNIVRRHLKPSQKNPAGGIVEVESGIHISNLMVYDPKERKPTRTGIKVLSTGEKIRFSKKSGEEI